MEAAKRKRNSAEQKTMALTHSKHLPQPSQTAESTFTSRSLRKISTKPRGSLDIKTVKNSSLHSERRLRKIFATVSSTHQPEKFAIPKWSSMKKSRSLKSSPESRILPGTQQHDESEEIRQLNGVDALLQAVAMYKSKDPKTPDEEEMVENLSMRCAKKMLWIIIRVLDFAMTNYPPACERFVDVMGLKTAFQLWFAVTGGILRGSRRDRLLSKCSNRVKLEAERLDQLELIDDLEMDEDEKYNRKLEAGLYTLQLLFWGHLWTSEHPRIRARIDLLLKQQKLTKQDVKDILQEYHDNIGDLEGPEEKERAQSKIQRFISPFDHNTVLKKAQYEELKSSDALTPKIVAHEKVWLQLIQLLGNQTFNLELINMFRAVICCPWWSTPGSSL
ncbi:hypothetical protein HAX54_007756 [Datura stramonium]|uniref:Beta-catenin-like protein 1 N-terminal domain-containing protein n=1 Tax=Datura stramonium TaxID=4076 RepID=A0ABS8RII3_DATST|nr:hypothetical protein [Datura stramonium]